MITIVQYVTFFPVLNEKNFILGKTVRITYAIYNYIVMSVS